ncbi:MAG: oligosaccharide flippase family protein [Novosphingobium sp.]|uniref:oligosaccharide flippase family protein n=1 Tax=Novosphingobium sp. TaxID=1874826 RepID=UPI0032BDAE32
MSIRRAAIWSFASQYASFVIQFATSVIISRYYLLPADVGLFSIALAAAMVVAIFQDMGISRFVTGQPEMREEHLRDYAAVAVGLGWGIAALVAAGAVPLARFYGEAGLAKVMLIIAGSYALFPFSIVPSAMLTRALDFRRLFQANAGSALAGAVVAIATAANGAGPAALAWGMVAATLARLILVMAAYPVLPRRPASLEIVKPMLGFGGSSFVISLSGAVGMRCQDLIVGRMLGVSATGLFTRASALAGQLTTLMVGAINSVFYPAFAKKRDAGEDLAAPYLHLIACNTGITWAAAIGLALAAEPVVHLLYGPNWADVAPLLRWTALAELFFVAMPLQMDVPILLGRIKPLVWINLLDTFITVVILVVASFWGLEAAAIGRILTGAIWLAIYASYIPRLVGIRYSALGTAYLKSAAVALAAGAPLALSRWMSGAGAEMGFISLLGLSLAGVFCWLVALPLVRHPFWQELRLALSHMAKLRTTQA